MCGGKGRSYALEGEQSFPLIQGTITGNSPCWDAYLEGFSLSAFASWCGAESQLVGQKAKLSLVLRARGGEVGRQQTQIEEQGHDS